MNPASNIISRLSALSLVLLTVLMTASCAGDRMEGIGDSDPDAGYLTLTLFSSSLGSRADDPDIDALNENRIASALVCLFPATAGDDDTPVFMQTVNPGVNTQAEVKLRINRDLIYQLFPDENISTARAYIIANLPATTAVPENPTLGQLKSLPIESNFASKEVQPSFVMDGIDDITLQRDPTDIATSSLSGEIRLTRSAAKINLAVKFAGEVTDGYGNVWVPVTTGSGMSALINNGVRRSAVTPSAHTLAGGDYYTTTTSATDENNRGRSLELEDSGAEYPYTLSKSPFYTYPNSWTDESDNMTYMTLSVLWKMRDENTFRTCYYMVPVLRDASALIRNVSYKVNLNIAILGSFTPDEPLLLEDVSYRAVDWGKENINVDINDYRYLVLDQTSYVMNNEASINIPFYSSHNTVVTNTKVTYYIYNYSKEGNEEPVDITETQNKNTDDITGQYIYSSEINNAIDPTTSSRTLKFDHELVQLLPRTTTGGTVVLGPTGTTYPEVTLATLLSQISYYTKTQNISYSRYEVEITIAHSDKVDDPNFSQTIHITQYPPMYIEATKNYYSSTNANNTPVRGNVYVNGNQSSNYDSGDANTYWARLRSDLPVNMPNPNMYVVTITNLNDNTYYIGDPRQTTIDNLTYNNNTNGYLTAANSGTAPNTRWASAPALGSTTDRRLTYYYPANPDKSYMYRVAPKLRISSAYSSSLGMKDIEAAKRRCAGYQETGFPAGRWRLPTVGELEFIIGLWLDGKIPALFSTSTGETSQTGTYYWTAQGPVPTILTADGKLNTQYLNSTNWDNWTYTRCVYDEWYWQDKGTVESTGTNTYDGVEYGTYPFTWGDAPMTSSN